MNQSDALYRRVHVVYDDAGVWLQARDGKRQLQHLDIDLGRAILVREGHAGTIEELHALAGSFDNRTPAVLPAWCCAPVKRL